jgi:hypothetical protein
MPYGLAVYAISFYLTYFKKIFNNQVSLFINLNLTFMKRVTSLLIVLFLWLSSATYAQQGTVVLGDGTASNSTTASPTPYGTYYKNLRQQYLVLASELSTIGLVAGDITAIGFNVANVNTCSAMPNYSMKVKATTATVLTTAFDNEGFAEVWTDPNFLPVNGWNTHTFNAPFPWDGTSNLLVDVCFDIIPGTYTQNASVYYTPTPAAAFRALYYRSDALAACGTTAAGTTSLNRANMQFTGSVASCLPPTAIVAGGVTNNSALISWTPSGASSEWDLLYGASGFDPLTQGTLIEGITNPSYSLTGLAANSPYQVYVRTDCGGDVSLWGGPTAFTTLCDVFNLPYVENFNGAVAGTFPNCWSKSGLATTNWAISATANALGTAPELKFGYSPSFTGEAYAISPLINTTGETSIAIEFKHFFDYYAVPFTIGMKTTSNGGTTWNTVWEVIDPTANLGPETVLLGVANSDVGSATFQFAFFLNGYTINMDNWYMDDISVFVPSFGTLAGNVSEATRGPVAGALITAGDYQTTTNASGGYSIPNMMSGTYDVTCTADGYFPVTVEDVVIAANQTTTQDFVLGYATISVAPESLTQTLLPGGTATQTLTISNTGGTEPLTWSGAIELMTSKGQKVSIPAAKQVTGSEVSRGKAPSTNASSTQGGGFDALRGSTGFGFDMYPGLDYINFDTDTPGVYSLTLPTTHTVFAGDFDGSNVFYAIDDDLAQLFTVDVATGVFTLVGSTLALTDLAFDYTTNTMYAVGYDDVSNSLLYTVNLSTGATTLVGDCGAGLVISLACDGNGNLYGFNIATDVIVSINKVNAAMTVIGSAGFDGNYAQSMAWDPATDIIYMSAYNNTSGQGELRIVDKVTGATALVGAFPAGAEICGLGFMGAIDTWISIDPVSGVIEPGASQDVIVTFDATDLNDSTYHANINIKHNGQELTDGTLVVPATLIVASTEPPVVPILVSPVNAATLVPLQPEFEWINGEGTSQVKFSLNKGNPPFAQLIHSTPWEVANSFNLADVGKALEPKTTYNWIVQAKNAAGTVTSAKWTFTTIGAGTISGVVTDAFSTLPLDGATITVEPGGYTATTGAAGTYSILKVLEGTFTVTAAKNGYGSASQDVVVAHNQTVTASFALNQSLDPPFGLHANVVDVNDVHLDWQSPGAGFAPEWLTYSGETITNSVGVDGPVDFDVAARFTPDMLTAFPGGSITKIQFVPSEADLICTYTLKVWEGVSPPTLIYSQVLPGITEDVWNEVVLTTPVPFDNTKELWFGFNVNTTAGFPAGCDAGPQVEGFGNMMFFGGEWTTLYALAPTLPYNWAVKGYVESAKGMAVLEPIKEANIATTNQGTLSLNPVAMKPTVSVTTDNSRALLSFNIYRNGTLLANTGVDVTEYNDMNLAAGTYAYTVKAQYTQGESPAVGPKTVAILPTPILLAAEPDFLGVDLLWQAGTNYPTDNMSGSYSTSNVKPVEKHASATLPIKEYDGCVLEMPAGAIVEAELCGEDLNGGCNSEVPAYTPIASGDVIFGSTFADGATRDTDWYELVLDTPKTITWEATAEFPVLIFIIDANSGDCLDYAIVSNTTALPCEAAILTATVAPGTYWLLVMPSAFEGVECGVNSNYIAELTTVAAFLPYFNVYRNGVDIADVFGNTYYDDVNITSGQQYCYKVSQVVAEGFETGKSNELCATIPMMPVIAVNPASLTETHIVPPAKVTTKTVTLTNNGQGPLDWTLQVNTSAPADLEYCDASMTSTQDEYISNVLCGTINNTSGWQATVANYTAISTVILAGGSEPITITNGNPWAADKVTCWVDWNKDFTFGVATDEEFKLLNVGGLGASFTGAIAVPAGTPNGNYRMRIRMNYSTDPVPCGAMSFGEIEDYTISVGQPWLSADLLEGTLAPNASTDITVSFNSEDLDGGIYNGALEFMSNDPITPVLMVPAVFNVQLASTATIAGYTTDATTRGPVGYVLITADELRYSTTTDENGYYELDVLPGNYLITAAKAGYITQTAEVTAVIDEVTMQNFLLEFAAPVLLYANGGIGEINLGWTGNPAVDGDNAVRYSTSNVEMNAERMHGPTVRLPIESGRAVGDDCSNPIVIGALPYTDVNSTCGRGNTYQETCLGSYDGGEDIVYQLVLTEAKTIELDLQTTGTWTGMLITTECPIGLNCVNFITGSTGPKNLVTDLAAGTYYIMIDTWPTPNCIDFTLTVKENVPCIVEMPVGAIAEGELCIEDEGEDVTNGGCNSEVPMFTTINCGDVIYGSASTYLSGTSQYRDTDWYQLVITEPQVVTFTVTAEFPSVAGLIEQIVPGVAGCDNITGNISPAATANPCDAASVTATLAPGTYYFFVGMSVFEGYPCGTSNNYTAELTCEETFIPYYNVIRDGDVIAQTYQETYTDSNVLPDVQYCYAVSQVIEPALVTPQSNVLCASVLCAGGCDYTMILTDDYGDGWNGASFTIKQGGTEIGTYTLSDGLEGTLVVSLCDGLETTFTWNNGMFDLEPGFELFDPEGNSLYAFVAGEAPLNGVVFFTFTTACPAGLSQEIVLPLGWSAWSSYFAPAANVSDVMAPVVADMVITQHFNELFYPAFGINTMGTFSNNHGYITKMAAAAILTINGNMADPTVQLHTGWNLISVLQECSIPAADVFGGIAGFVIAWEPTGNGIYYPEYDIYTLTTLSPGKAYYVKVTEPSSFTYPGCDKSSGNMFSAPLRAANTTSWNDVAYTGVNHVVVFDSKATNNLRIGDMIGAFANGSVCAGLVEYTGANLGFTLFGDDFTTMANEGFTEGDVMTYKVFRAETGEEFTMDAVYSLDAPNSSTFVTNGLSVITDLKLAPLSIGENTLKNLSIYPNPSSGIFNIAVNGLDTQINYVVMNAQGQEIYNGNLLESQQLDLSNEAKGIYFIKFISDSVLRVEKLVVK